MMDAENLEKKTKINMWLPLKLDTIIIFLFSDSESLKRQ